MSKIIPILKWAGGKRQLLPEIIPLIPNSYETYYEPFVGAGAVLFELQPLKAVINDMNAELMNVYQVIKESPEQLINRLQEYSDKHCKELFYATRALDHDIEKFKRMSSVDKAARTIYLNRTCFNGLYRVNKAGYFNTPIGRNSTITILNKEGIIAIHEYLVTNEISFMTGDYHDAIRSAGEKDFVFLDPPYYPMNKDSFVRYDSGSFGPEEQHELKLLCDELTEKGVRFMQTNSCCDEIRSLYNSYVQYEVDARRCINARVDGRRGKEIIICNYQ